jgi:two-component system, chemotaxis family, response regulator Rcp1
MSGSPFQIVLVEDTEWEVFLIREALEQAGLVFELHVLDDGEKALELIAKIESDETVPLPRLIMLDLNLPKVSGGQVLERVRQSSRCGPIPVFVLTSSDSPKDKAEIARLGGATQYFRKSFRLDEFMSLGLVVRELLEKGDLSSRASAR